MRYPNQRQRLQNGKEGLVMPPKIKLWRAADDNILSKHMSLAQHREDAEAYLDNPGFGGSTLWSIDVRPKHVLDLSDDDDEFASIAYAVDADERTLAAIMQGFPSVGVMLANLWRVAERLSESYDWVVFRDDFPEDAITWWYLGDDDLRMKRTRSAGHAIQRE